MIVWLVVAVVVWGTVVLLAFFGVPFKESSGTQKVKWSIPSEKILNLYNEIPESNRPGEDLEGILRALEVKHGGIEAVNWHFTRGNSIYYSGEEFFRNNFSWDHHCLANRCWMQEFRDVFKSLTDLKDSLAAQERALQVAAVRGELDRAEAFMEQVRREREIADEVTKELS